MNVAYKTIADKSINFKKALEIFTYANAQFKDDHTTMSSKQCYRAAYDLPNQDVRTESIHYMRFCVILSKESFRRTASRVRNSRNKTVPMQNLTCAKLSVMRRRSNSFSCDTANSTYMGVRSKLIDRSVNGALSHDKQHAANFDDPENTCAQLNMAAISTMDNSLRRAKILSGQTSRASQDCDNIALLRSTLSYLALFITSWLAQMWMQFLTEADDKQVHLLSRVPKGVEVLAKRRTLPAIAPKSPFESFFHMKTLSANMKCSSSALKWELVSNSRKCSPFSEHFYSLGDPG
ncbi:hypothetical protein N0V93_006064 [Gnomoniopsis smithogilvyi]|uniref:Uncharacterized protein n=1 Tax=Gnomoniopsis smithogilvyi TaxID=1191159 RepID=A0A9W8YNX9_9PEZI|nr:hypothetical protein N0V93_006064 [Gnomoniopsis smithogilvyi]